MIIEFNLIIFSIFIYTYTFFRCLYLFTKNKSISLSNEINSLGLYISIVLIISQTIFPIRLNITFSGFEIYNLVPFKVPLMIYNQHNIRYFIHQVFGNIALFIPFGFFVYYKTEFNIKRSIQACLLLTLFIEITQGFIPYRFCEIDDIWLNTLGGSIGIFSSYIYLRAKNY